MLFSGTNKMEMVSFQNIHNFANLSPKNAHMPILIGHTFFANNSCIEAQETIIYR